MLVTAISIVSAIVLAQNGHAGTNPLVIKVEARQFAWKFTYPNGKSYGSLRLPLDRHVKLDITADDVIHSFWVPQLSQKQDAVPGQHNSLVITPTHIGTYPVICTELCGLGHALMRSHVDILRAGGLREVGRAAAAAASAGAARARGLPAERLRRLPHVQAGARDGQRRPATSTTWRRRPRRRTAAPLEAFIEESIVKPDAYIAPGFTDAMPHTFGTQIPPDKLDSSSCSIWRQGA